MARAAEKRRRQRERKQQLSDDVERVLKNKAPKEQIGDLPDDALFFLDETPAAAAPEKGERKAKKAKKKGSGSDKSGSRAKAQQQQQRAAAKRGKKQGAGEEQGDGAVYDLWGAAAKPAASSSGGKRAKAPRRPNKSKGGKAGLGGTGVLRLSTVVEPAGCSYNPRFEDHQDVVAEIVAEEKQKALMQSANRVESLRLAAAAAAKDEAGAGNDKRLKEAAHQVPDQKFVSVKKTLKEIRREERLLEEKVQRKQEEAEERKKSLPPRLGRKRYQPEPSKVLTTDDVTGSIRELSSAPMLATSAFNKLQRKGLIEPRDQAVKRRKRRVIRA